MKTNFYSIILKATGAFGVFQLLRMAIRLVVGKIAAIFLGPSGLGLIGMIDNTLNLCSAISGLGLNISGVRQIASASNEEEERESISLLKKAALFTGIFGMLLFAMLSPVISYMVFGTTSKYYWFLMLSPYFIFFNISNVNNAILQGKRKLKLLLISNFVLTLSSAILSYILYATFREWAILPVFLGTSILGFVISHWVVKKVSYQSIVMPFSELVAKSKSLIQLGYLLSINVILGQVCYYGIRLFLKTQDVSVTTLGFYEVGNVFLVSYLGLVFSAMSNDFYPKLTTLSQDKPAFNALINQQIQVALLIVTPMVLFFYTFQYQIIKILYTINFYPVIKILSIGLLSIILKAIMWPMGFIPLALSDNKEYFRQNVAGDVFNLLLSIVGYHYFGLSGLGMAIVLNFSIFIGYLLYISKKKYDFVLNKQTFVIFLTCLFLGCGGSFFSLNEKNFIILFIIFLSASLFSMRIFYAQMRNPK